AEAGWLPQANRRTAETKHGPQGQIRPLVPAVLESYGGLDQRTSRAISPRAGSPTCSNVLICRRYGRGSILRHGHNHGRRVENRKKQHRRGTGYRILPDGGIEVGE